MRLRVGTGSIKFSRRVSVLPHGASASIEFPALGEVVRILSDEVANTRSIVADEFQAVLARNVSVAMAERRSRGKSR